MTDRLKALTVVLERDIRDDDAQRVMDAIQCFRGVLSVKGEVANVADHIAFERASHDLEAKLWEALHG